MTREEASAALPFFVNGTLERAEEADLSAWLERDGALRAELEALRGLRARMQAEEVVSPGEAGLERLMQGLDRLEPANLPRAPRRLQIAAAILAAVVAVQAFFLMRPGEEPGGYQLASGGEVALTVAFRPDGTEAEIRAALLEAGLVIVDGPSALGFYGLAALDGVELGAAMAVLEASGLVTEMQRQEE